MKHPLSTVFLIAVIGASPTPGLTQTATCNIEIEDYSSIPITRYAVVQKHEHTEAGDRQYFKLPGADYRCSLTFFNNDGGTALACELDQAGHHYVQSDRTAIKGSDAKNNLYIRYEQYHYGIKTSCE